MPTPLAQLPSNQPIPNGRVQYKQGAAAMGVWTVSNLVAEGTKYPDGAGGFMQIGVTPRYECRWIVRANAMVRGQPGSPGWQRVDFQIRLSPADLDGYSLRICIMHVYDGNTVGFRTFSGVACFRLAAGVAYTAHLAHGYSSGYYQDVYIAPVAVRIIGRTVGEGVL